MLSFKDTFIREDVIITKKMHNKISLSRSAPKPSYIGEDPPLQQSLVFDLSTGEYQFFRDPTVVGTGGSNPCLGLIIYDSFDRYAFAAHLYGGMHNPDANPNYAIIKRGIGNFSNSRRLVAYLCGLGGADDQDNRASTLELLLNCGLSNDRIYSRWAKNPDYLQSMIVDTQTGEVNYLEVSVFEYLEFGSYEG